MNTYANNGPNRVKKLKEAVLPTTVKKPGPETNTKYSSPLLKPKHIKKL